MDINFRDNIIFLNKRLNKLDEFAISFSKKLDDLNIGYVFVSGYVSILFGLGTEKDIEDAKYLYSLFEKDIDRNLLDNFLKRLKKTDVFNKYIK